MKVPSPVLLWLEAMCRAVCSHVATLRRRRFLTTLAAAPQTASATNNRSSCISTAPATARVPVRSATHANITTSTRAEHAMMILVSRSFMFRSLSTARLQTVPNVPGRFCGRISPFQGACHNPTTRESPAFFTLRRRLTLPFCRPRLTTPRPARSPHASHRRRELKHSLTLSLLSPTVHTRPAPLSTTGDDLT